MSTGDKKSNIYLKKFLPQQQMTENFLEYLAKRDEENLKLQYPEQGYFFGNSMAGSGPDEITAATPSLATDGQGHLLKLDPSQAAAKFENNLGDTYYVGMRYNVREKDTEVNVRTGAIEYTFLEDAIGEKGEPDVVIDNGSTLRLEVDGLFEVGVSHAGRQAVVYLKRAVGQADAFFTGLVTFVSGKNVVDTTTLIGQTAGLVSTDPSDYWVFIPGLTIRKTDLRVDPNYVFLGTVIGVGAGNTPTSGDIDNSEANVLYDGGAFSTLVNTIRSFLVGGGSIAWDLTAETLTLGADLRLKPASVPFDYQMVAATLGPIADGECGYIDLDGVGGIKPVVIADLALVPDDPKYQPIFYRYGNDIMFWMGALELQGDAGSVTTGRIDGVTEDLLSYIGAQNESDADPDYVNATGSAKPNVHLTQGESLTRSIKKLELRDDVVTKVKAVDFNLTVLPSGPAVVIDAQTLINGDRVLFANAILNGVYQVAGIGVAATWTKLPVFGLSDVPQNMSLVAVKDGSKEFIKTMFQYTSTRGWTPMNLADLEAEPTGFENQTDSEILFDDGTRTFTVQPKAPATAFYISQKGRLFKFESPQTVVIPDVEGMHFIYFDGANLVSTQVFDYSIILGKAFAASVYWDATNNQSIMFSNERHMLTMDGRTHLYLHNTMGVQWVGGLGLNFALGSGAVDADAQVSVDDGRIFDEDLEVAITNDPAPSEPFEQILDPIAEIPILYRDGINGEWRKYAATQFPAKLGTARLQYNNPAGPWTTPDAPADGHHVAMWLFATNDIRHPVIALMGQRSDLALVDAQAGNTFESLLFGELPSLEMKALFRVIYQTDSAYANSIKAKIADVVDLRKAEDVSLGSYAPSAHNLLSARSAPEAHPASSIKTVLTNFLGALSEDDIEVQKALETFDKHFQQLRLKEHPSNLNRVIVTGSSVTLSTGTVLEQQIKNLILKFDGAEIDFATGEIFEADGTTPFNGGLNDFTPIVPAANQFRWFSVTLLPSTANPNNTINGQLIVLAGSADGASKILAPRAPFASGTKIGQVVVEEDTGAIADIFQDDITQQGTGGGGSGEGTGDANSFLEDLKARLRDSFWKWLTPNIFSQQEATLVDPASTGAYDIANTEYDLAAIGNLLLTLNLFGSKFKESDSEALGAELHVLWNLEDPIATYEMSLNGGGTWEPVTMDQIAGSKKYVGEIKQFSPASSILHENAVGTADATKTFNATTQQYQAMPIVVASGAKQKTISGNLYFNKLGAPTGDLFIRLVKDNAGVPSNAAADILAEASPISIGGLAAGDITIPVSLSARLPAGTYWLVAVPSDLYRSAGFSAGVNELRWRTDASAPTYAGGTLNIYNGTTWSAVAGEDACFQLSGFVYDLRVRITSATTDVSLNGLGVLFSETGAFTKDTPLPEFQRFVVDGLLDQTVFQMTTFVPDPTTLRVISGFTGQTFIHGDFQVNGRDVIFPSGTFLFPGDIKGVVFDQRMGFGQGNDRALAILAANALGSTDPQYDLSLAGKGILLRRPDGTLRMLRLDNSDNIVIESVP